MKYSSYFFLICAFFNLNTLKAGFIFGETLRKNLSEGTMVGIGVASTLLIPAIALEFWPLDTKDQAIREFRREIQLAAMSTGIITVFCTLLSIEFNKKFVGCLIAAALSGCCVSAQFARKGNGAYGEGPSLASRGWWFLGGAGASSLAASVGWGFWWLLNKYYIGSSKPRFA